MRNNTSSTCSFFALKQHFLAVCYVCRTYKKIKKGVEKGGLVV